MKVIRDTDQWFVDVNDMLFIRLALSAGQWLAHSAARF